MFEFTTWHASFPDFFISLRHYTVIGNQLLLSIDRNRVRGAVLSLSQDGASTHLFENFPKNSLERDLSNDTAANTPLFSLANTFKVPLYSKLDNSPGFLNPYLPITVENLSHLSQISDIWIFEYLIHVFLIAPHSR